MTISIFASIPLAPKFPRAMWVDPKRCLHIHYQKGILILGNMYLLCGVVSMLDLCYLPKFSKSGTKGNQCLCCKICRNARDLAESSLKEELSLSVFCIQSLLQSLGKNKMQPNHNVFYEKLDKERRTCLMLGSPKAEWRMKIHMETLSQNNPVREWGKQQRRWDSSSQVLWQKALSWRKTLELRLCVKVLTWGIGFGLPNCYPLKSLAKAITKGTLALYTWRKRCSNTLHAGSRVKALDKDHRRQKHTEPE